MVDIEAKNILIKSDLRIERLEQFKLLQGDDSRRI